MKPTIALIFSVICCTVFAEPMLQGPHVKPYNPGDGLGGPREEAPTKSAEERFKDFLRDQKHQELLDKLCSDPNKLMGIRDALREEVPSKAAEERYKDFLVKQAATELASLKKRFEKLKSQPPEKDQALLRQGILENMLKLKEVDEFNRYLKITKAWTDKVAPEKADDPNPQMPKPQGYVLPPNTLQQFPGNFPGPYPGYYPKQYPVYYPGQYGPYPGMIPNSNPQSTQPNFMGPNSRSRPNPFYGKPDHF